MISRSQKTTQLVRIDAVDAPKNTIHCVSKDGGRFSLRVPVASGVYRIPKTGEYWIVKREDLTNWYFEGIMESEGKYGSSYPLEGDIVLDSANNVNISARAVFINNEAIGVWASEEFEVDAETGQLELSNPPASETIQVFNNGLLIPPSGIIIREQILLFQDSLEEGWVVIYYMRLPE
jgi:hypothetical protein